MCYVAWILLTQNCSMMLHYTCSACLGWIGLLRTRIGSGWVQKIKPTSICALRYSTFLLLPRRFLRMNNTAVVLLPVLFVSMNVSVIIVAVIYITVCALCCRIYLEVSSQRRSATIRAPVTRRSSHPIVTPLYPVPSLPALGPWAPPSRTGPLARNYLPGFPYS